MDQVVEVVEVEVEERCGRKFKNGGFSLDFVRNLLEEKYKPLEQESLTLEAVLNKNCSEEHHIF